MTAWEEHEAASAVPPQDVEAERVVLVALMANPDLASDAGLKADHYYTPRHAVIHDAIMALHVAGEPTDPIAVQSRVSADGNLARVGASYLAELYTSNVANVGTVWHAREVVNKSLLRRVQETGRRMDQFASRPGADPADVLAQAQEWLTGVSDLAAPTGPVRWGDIVSETFDDLEAQELQPKGSRGVSFGLVDVDRMTSGLKPGQLAIIAARPGVGKTICAVDMARAAALRQGTTTLLLSLEMTRVEIAKRLIAAQYKVPLSKLTAADLTDDDWTFLAKSTTQHSDAPLWIDDTAGQSLSTIRANARRLHRTHDLGLLIVDYLQLIETTRSSRNENRQQEVSALSRGLKLLARELAVPVVMCAQLNRGPEHRSDKRPLLSDLRESGSLEQDSDVVILLNRPEYYDPDDRPGEVDVDVAKNRNGPTGVVTVAAQLHFSRFVDMELDEPDRYLRGVA